MSRSKRICFALIMTLACIGNYWASADESAIVTAIRYYEKKKYQLALRILEEIIAKDPNDVEAINNRGLNKFALGDYTAARNDYNKVLSINPRHAKAINNLGFLKFRLGDVAAAMADYEKALSINPRLAKAYNNRGVARYSLGEKQAAIADYDIAIGIDSTLSEAFLNRGTAYYGLGNIENARKDYNQAVVIDPDYAEAYFGRGLTRYAVKDKIGACSDWNTAFALGFTKDAQVINNICLPEHADLNQELNPPDLSWVSRLRILTEKNKSEVRPQYMDVINKVVTLLKAYPAIRLEIQGHADSVNLGTDKDLNRKLSQKRAEAVKAAIAKQDIESDRMVAVGYGDARPIESNATEDGRIQNRRIEFVIIKN